MKMSTCNGEREPTSKEMDLVKTSWAVFDERSIESGYLLFKVLFKNNPEYKELFPFRDVREEDWLENAKFLHHTTNGMKGLTTMINAIDDPEKLDTFLSKIRESHEKKNLTANHYIAFREAIIELVSSFLDEEALEAWKKTMNMITDIIVSGFKQKTNN